MRVTLEPDRSLGEVISTVVADVSSIDTGYPKVMRMWNRIFQIIDESEESNTMFINTLSRTEYISFCLLRDWWHTYNPIAQSFIFFRRKNLNRQKRRSISENEPVVPVKHFFDLEIHGVFYHDMLSRLFVREFSDGEKIWDDNLFTLRDRATQMASIHKLTLNLCYDLPSTFVEDRGERPRQFDSGQSEARTLNITSTLDACPWLSPQEKSGRPYYLWDIQNKRTVKSSEAGDPPYICMSHTWGRWRLKDKVTGRSFNTNIQGVPWPIPLNSKFAVQALPDRLQEAGFVEEYVWFDLLCIPQCGFQKDIMTAEIARQAAIFGTATSVGVWVNDVESWANTQHSLRWLGARYFQNTSWGAGFRFDEVIPNLVNPPQTHSPVREINMEALDASANQPPGLLVIQNEEHTVPSWFTSLWTLQEFSLRPDMILYDRSWRHLQTSIGKPVYLDEFIAFMHFAQTKMMRPHRFHHGFYDDHADAKPWKNPVDRFLNRDRVDVELHKIPMKVDLNALWPAGPLELSLLTAATYMVHMYQGPSKILRHGDTRQCSGRRAEAIMSALGAIDWYAEYMRNITSESGQAPDLVMGKYPVAFLDEVIHRIGADFFSSRFCHAELGPHDIQRTFVPTMTPIGSLLPFSGEQLGEGFQVHQNVELELNIVDHPAVRSWTVQADGTVRILKAGIMAMTNPDTGTFQHLRQRLSRRLNRRTARWVRMQIDAPLLISVGGTDVWIESQEQLSITVSTPINTILVCLGDGQVESYGVVLQQISPNSGDADQKIMVKVGNWYSFNAFRPKGRASYSLRQESDTLPSTDVNWRVM